MIKPVCLLFTMSVYNVKMLGFTECAFWDTDEDEVQNNPHGAWRELGESYVVFDKGKH
jgi:hypothetical protein